MPHSREILGLNGYEIKDIQKGEAITLIWVNYTGEVSCPHCGSKTLRKKDMFIRQLRHETWGERHNVLMLESCKYHCLSCKKYFNQRFPGVLPRRRSTELFRRQVYQQHYDGICRKRLAERQRIGAATVERWFHDHLKLNASKMKSEPCPKILGIDEHFFTRKDGFATTLADLKNRKVYDVALGRSEASLKDYLDKLEGKDDVRLVCMDLAETYRNIAKNHFPNAKIVADRFHVIKLVNHHFLATWRQLDPIGSKNRGLLSLMRRHHDRLKPEQKLLLQEYFKEHQAMALIYEFKQKLTDLLRKKSQTFQQCKVLAPMLLDHINKLKESEFQCLKTLGETLCSWQEEIACMWRYTRNNGITEGFHNKMEMISRQAFGFRNFNNYRLRVRVMCA